MLILDEFNDTWNYTFIIVAVISIIIGTFLTIRKINKENYMTRREKRNNEKTSEKE